MNKKIRYCLCMSKYLPLYLWTLLSQYISLLPPFLIAPNANIIKKLIRNDIEMSENKMGIMHEGFLIRVMMSGGWYSWNITFNFLCFNENFKNYPKIFKLKYHGNYRFAKLAGAAENLLKNIRPDRLRLIWDFQNCLWNFSNLKIKEDMNFSTFIGRKRRWTAKNGKTVNESRPDRLRLKRDFQNCL